MVWRITLVLFCLSWGSHAQDLTAIELALLDESRAWTLAAESSTGLTDYFTHERERLTTERADLAQERASFDSERARFQRERAVYATLRAQLSSDRQQTDEDSTRLDARAKRLARVEWTMKAAPFVAGGLFAAGLLTGLALR